MKKRRTLVSIMMMFMFVVQIIGGALIKVKAESNTGATVQILGYDGKMVEGTTNKSNALEALKDVLGKNNIKYVEKDNYVSSINDLGPGKFSSGGGWMYVVKKGASYDPQSVLNGMAAYSDLKSGDKMIVYYGDWATIKTANDIAYSTNLSNQKLNVTLVNKDLFGGADSKITNIKAEIRDANGNAIPSTMNDNVVTVEKGLNAGNYTLSLSDYKNDGLPKVVADEFSFTIKDSVSANVRIEGLNGTIFEGKGSGKNAIEIFKNAVGDKVKYSSTKSEYGEYISSIDGINSGMFGGYDGWMFYDKNSKKIDNPQVGMSEYVPQDGDELIVYYTDSNVPFLTGIKFNPQIVKENEKFSMQFIWTTLNWTTNKNEDKPIKNAVVTIDGTNYTTNDQGMINVKGLPNGDHAYAISGYNYGKMNTVVMDKGTFKTDGVNAPGFDFSDNGYNNHYNNDNTKVVKNYSAEVKNISSVLSGYSDPWVAVSLKKLGMKPDDKFVQDAYAEMKQYGISEYNAPDIVKLIMGLTACGYSPYDFAGQDLVSYLYNEVNYEKAPSNFPIFSLITYNYLGIDDSKYKVKKDDLKKIILSDMVEKNGNKGWVLSNNESSINVDVTAAALTALAPSFNEKNPEVVAAVNDAVKSLGNMENESGYLMGQYPSSAESNAFAILGLLSVGVNPEGVTTLSDNTVVSFAKAKGDLVSALLSFKIEDGKYKHSMDSEKFNVMATEEALRAMISMKDIRENNSGKVNFYVANVDASKLASYAPKKDQAGEEAKTENKTGNTQKESNGATILPKTGSAVTYGGLMAMGSVLAAMGVVFLKKRH